MLSYPESPKIITFNNTFFLVDMVLVVVSLLYGTTKKLNASEAEAL